MSKATEKKGPYFTEEDLKQIRAAVQAVGKLEGYVSIADFVEAAARRELRRLQRKYNDGKNTAWSSPSSSITFSRAAGS